jgi:prevent-host-death family protein
MGDFLCVTGKKVLTRHMPEMYRAAQKPVSLGQMRIHMSLPSIPRGSPATSEISTVEARNNFSDIVNRAAYGKERVILTRRGKPIAAIIPAEDLLVGSSDDGAVSSEI